MSEELGVDWETMYGADSEVTRRTRQEGERLIELTGAVENVGMLDGQYTVHRLLGYANQIQGDVQTICQRAVYGAEMSGAREWQLLLQVDTDAAAGTHWGDVGRIYFLIERAALARREFDRTWVIMQCC
jgi:hypothetical protein